MTEPAADSPLAEILARLPAEPGVYLMKDRAGTIVYIGKAASLRSRVRSYFTRSGDDRFFVGLLGDLLGDIETIVTANEKEALLLENNLIKQHQPRFNMRLVDDKNFLVLRLDLDARYPRLEVVRRIGRKGDDEQGRLLGRTRNFGPFDSASDCRQTLRVINRHFKLRTCTDHVLATRRRPCLQYQIKRCDAPCVFPVPAEQYDEQVRDVILFLERRSEELLGRLRERMQRAADELEFERAAELRDQLESIARSLEEQSVVLVDPRDHDVIGCHREGELVEIAVLHLREGKLLGRQTFSLRGQAFPDEEILSSFVSRYYAEGRRIPDQVLLPVAIEDAAVKQEWLRELRGRAVEIAVPRRGERARLLDLARANALASFRTRRDRVRDVEEVLGKLQRRLHLRRPPRRIECFDISHIQGRETVASMVVLLDGEPARSEYRRFRVRTAGNDDFAAMYEVLSRRLRRSQEGEGRPWPVADLVVIDGGKGQLGSALAALRDRGVGVEGGLDGPEVVALAKERGDGADEEKPDRVFRPGVKEAIPLRPHSAELFLLSRARDEAHRFAVTYHQEVRDRRTLRSSLEDIPGVGKQRARELLRSLGSLRKIRAATVEELGAVPGIGPALAAAIHRHLHEGEGPAAST